MSEVYNLSFYQQHLAGSLTSARIMLPLLYRYAQPRSVVDVGCGLGPWLKAAMELGATDVLGIDGDYVDRGALLIAEENFRPADLRERIRTDRRFDLAISMEVAEHLPYERSETFIGDLVALSDVVLFSAALPYQGGTDHINEQWLEFWAILFRRHGYLPYDFLRGQCWSNPDVEFWYSQNVIVFCAAEYGARTFPAEFMTSGYPLSRPHPLTFLVNVGRYRPLAAAALDPEWQDYQAIMRAYERSDGIPPPLQLRNACDKTGRSLFPASRMTITDVPEGTPELQPYLQEVNKATDWYAEELRKRDTIIADQQRQLRELTASLSLTEERVRDEESRKCDAIVADQQRQLRDLRASLSMTEERVRHLENSWSWRLTKPLRRLGGIVTNPKPE